MIGAIIGDLAAWTWENDHEKFINLLFQRKHCSLNLVFLCLQLQMHLTIIYS
jgi:hypothetical protein